MRCSHKERYDKIYYQSPFMQCCDITKPPSMKRNCFVLGGVFMSVSLNTPQKSFNYQSAMRYGKANTVAQGYSFRGSPKGVPVIFSHCFR